MIKRNRLLQGIMIAAAGASLLIGGAMAYLTDYDTAANEFTVGKVDIELQEPGWNPDEYDKLVPTQDIKKDPQVKNVGINDAFVYLEVSVPVAKVITADSEGKRNKLKDTELFTYTPGKDWLLMDSYMSGTNMIYQYVYTKILPANQTSSALFEKMTFANIIEGQLDGQVLNVPVRAYAIQTVNTGDGQESVVEQAKAAFTKYINQNKQQPGAASVKS